MPRKSKTKSKKHTRRHRKHRGGFYGAAGAIAPGAMEWGRGSEAGAYAVDLSDRGKNSFHLGAGKKRRSTRRHRGGGRYGAVSASYTGTGERGMINVEGVNTKNGTGAPQVGSFNDNGGKSGDFKSFVRAF